MEKRRVKDSQSSISRVMMPPDANLAGNVFGGTILKMIDEIAGIVATKHSRRNCVTASIEHMDFIYPVHIGNLVELRAKMGFVGKSSMEVVVEVFAENLEKGDVNFTGRAVVAMVALDENGRPVEVPQIELETDEEKRLFEEGLQRHDQKAKKAKELNESTRHH